MKKSLIFIAISAVLLTGCSSNRLVFKDTMSETDAFVNAKLLESVNEIEHSIAELKAVTYGKPIAEQKMSNPIKSTVANPKEKFTEAKQAVKKTADEKVTTIEKTVKNEKAILDEKVTAKKEAVKEQAKEQVKEKTEYLNKLITPVDIEFTGKASSLLEQLSSHIGYKFKQSGVDTSNIRVNTQTTVQDALESVSAQLKDMADIKVNQKAKTITLINKAK
jgi:lipoprotein